MYTSAIASPGDLRSGRGGGEASMRSAAWRSVQGAWLCVPASRRVAVSDLAVVDVREQVGPRRRRVDVRASTLDEKADTRVGLLGRHASRQPESAAWGS